MLAEYKTDDGYTLQVYSSLYIDYGLRILYPCGCEMMDNPSCLSADSYGHKVNPEKYDDWDIAERAERRGDDNAFLEWDESDWVDVLKSEAWELIEGYESDEPHVCDIDD